MMKKIIISLMSLFITVNCFAYQHDPWTTQDTIFQGTFYAVCTIDIWQTYIGLYKDNKRETPHSETENYYTYERYESNPILGNHPSKGRLFLTAGAWVVIHTGISYILPTSWRNIWQAVWITEHSTCIYHNYQAGIRIHF